MTPGATTSDQGQARAPDGSTPPLDGATGSSNAIGTGGAPAGSASGRDGTPVAPESLPRDPQSDETGSESGVPARGDSGTEIEPSSGGAAGTGSGGAGGAPSASGAGGVPEQVACGGGDACGACLCENCEEELAACTDTPGCFEIVACARSSGCSGLACYCGTTDLLECATTDLANGPCLAVTLAAPDAHRPSLINPNAGPASEAALDLADCKGQNCVATCGN